MPATSDPSPLAALSASLSGLVAATAPSLVSVHSHRSVSSGFVWKPGLIVTADEALAEEGESGMQGPSSSPACSSACRCSACGHSLQQFVCTAMGQNRPKSVTAEALSRERHGRRFAENTVRPRQRDLERLNPTDHLYLLIHGLCRPRPSSDPPAGCGLM
jgi:hypothetical protein